MAENFSIEHSRTKITEVKKTIEDKKQKLDELKQQKKSLMDAGLALDSSNLDSAVQATLMESINDSLRDVENKSFYFCINRANPANRSFDCSIY